MSIPKLVYLQNFTKKQKCLNLGTKMPDLGIFWLKFEKNTAKSAPSKPAPSNVSNCKILQVNKNT